MTVFSTIYVPDGIVFVSDSRITLNNKNEDGSITQTVLSNNEQKIYLLKNGAVGFVYTADNMPDGFSMKEFLYNVDKFILKPEDEIIETVTKVSQYINEVPSIKFSIIMAGYENKGLYVYLIENKKITLLNRDVENNEVFGITNGGNLKRINQIFDYRNGDKFKNYSLEQALEYGKFLVEDSIEYLNKLDDYSDVGGNVQYLTINKHGGISFVK